MFNHTGSQSLYFNADGFYPTLGAAQSKASPYYDWYSFHPWPYDYDSWWGIRTLPAVREDSPSYVDYILDGEDSILRRWLRLGASGWRLDVADELPDWFIEKARMALEGTDSEAMLIGEVWEDGSNKIAYSQRRRYLLGSELHGLMNYPFRTALLAYLKGGDADAFREAMETLRENYPPAAFYSAMNFLGTHDTARILTVLGADTTPASREERAYYRLSDSERTRGLALLHLAALVLFTFPGAPTIYYGDEAGMEGFEDPFNRRTYPWGREDRQLRAYFARLGGLRRRYTALQRGSISYLYTAGSILISCPRASGHPAGHCRQCWQWPPDPLPPLGRQRRPGSALWPALLCRRRTTTADPPPQSGYLLILSQWPGRDVSRETPCPGLLVFHGMFHVKHPMKAANF